MLKWNKTNYIKLEKAIRKAHPEAALGYSLEDCWASEKHFKNFEKWMDEVLEDEAKDFCRKWLFDEKLKRALK